MLTVHALSHELQLRTMLEPEDISGSSTSSHMLDRAQRVLASPISLPGDGLSSRRSIDEPIFIVVGETSFSTTRELLQNDSGALQQLTAPGSGWNRRPSKCIHLTGDAFAFHQVLCFLTTNRISKGLSRGETEAVADWARRLGMNGLQNEAEFIYPLREEKRHARHTENFVMAYAVFADELFVQGRHSEAEMSWEKLEGQYSCSDLLALYDVAQYFDRRSGVQADLETQIRKGLVHMHLARAADEARIMDSDMMLDGKTLNDVMYMSMRQAVTLVPSCMAARRLARYLEGPITGLSQQELYRFRVAQYESILDEHPHSDRDWAYLGAIHKEHGHLQLAREAWESALACNPGCMEARLQRTLDLREFGPVQRFYEELELLRAQDTYHEFADEIAELFADVRSPAVNAASRD